MKKIFSTLLLLVVVCSSYAQLKFEGVVIDSLKTPLELANVVAINKETSALESYGITNEAGQFKLKLEKNTTYRIQVSYVGMETFNDSITTKEEDIF